MKSIIKIVASGTLLAGLISMFSVAYATEVLSGTSEPFSETSVQESYSEPEKNSDTTLPDYKEADPVKSQERYRKFVSCVDEMVNETTGEKIFNNEAETDDNSLINVQYGILKDQLNQKGYGKTGDLKIPESNEGYAKELATKFKDTYGVVMNEMATEDIELPKDFDVSGMMNEFSSIRNSKLKDYKNNKAYKDAAYNISLGGSFKIAGKPMDLPNMGSLEDFKANLVQDISNTNNNMGKGALNLDDVDLNQVSEEFFQKEQKENKKWFDVSDFYKGYQQVVENEEKVQLKKKPMKDVPEGGVWGASEYDRAKKMTDNMIQIQENGDVESWFDTSPFYKELKDKMGDEK